MEYSRQESSSEWPFPSPKDLPDSGIEPVYPILQADSLLSEPPGKPENTQGPPKMYMDWKLAKISPLKGFFLYYQHSADLSKC